MHPRLSVSRISVVTLKTTQMGVDEIPYATHPPAEGGIFLGSAVWLGLFSQGRGPGIQRNKSDTV